jgi:hypothetical protein
MRNRKLLSDGAAELELAASGFGGRDKVGGGSQGNRAIGSHEGSQAFLPIVSRLGSENPSCSICFNCCFPFARCDTTVPLGIFKAVEICL